MSKREKERQNPNFEFQKKEKEKKLRLLCIERNSKDNKLIRTKNYVRQRTGCCITNPFKVLPHCC